MKTVWLRDLDGTGSMHLCSKGDSGAVEYAPCFDNSANCVLRNQTEIMGALSLLLRHVAKNLVGKGGELDRQRDDLMQRHRATQLALSAVPRPYRGEDGK